MERLFSHMLVSVCGMTVFSHACVCEHVPNYTCRMTAISPVCGKTVFTPVSVCGMTVFIPVSVCGKTVFSHACVCERVPNYVCVWNDGDLTCLCVE